MNVCSLARPILTARPCWRPCLPTWRESVAQRPCRRPWKGSCPARSRRRQAVVFIRVVPKLWKSAVAKPRPGKNWPLAGGRAVTCCKCRKRCPRILRTGELYFQSMPQHEPFQGGFWGCRSVYAAALEGAWRSLALPGRMGYLSPRVVCEAAVQRRAGGGPSQCRKAVAYPCRTDAQRFSLVRGTYHHEIGISLPARRLQS